MSEKYIWVGASKTEYTYFIYPIDFKFKAGQDGNYIFCKEVKIGWTPIYIGEGDFKERTEFRIKDECVIKKGATHIHAHLNNNEKSRKAEETDLLNSHPEAYAPTGCNIKEGG